MTQATALAVGTTAATSTDITVDETGAVTVGLFATSAPVPAYAVGKLYQDSPSGDVYLGDLTNAQPTRTLIGPGTYRVRREPGPSFGVFTEAPAAA